MTGRARRRHDRWRMVRKAIRLFRRWDRGISAPRRAHDAERLADHLACCSCLACRNPQADRWHQRREDRAAIDQDDQIVEG